MIKKMDDISKILNDPESPITKGLMLFWKLRGSKYKYIIPVISFLLVLLTAILIGLFAKAFL